MKKISNVEAGQITKLAAENLRALSEENQEMRQQLATYQKRDHAEKIAHAMEDKGLEPEASFDQKVEGLLKRDDLTVIEAAVGMSAPQMKVASVHDAENVEVEGGSESQAEQQFVANLTSL
jgi:hypothetical protein